MNDKLKNIDVSENYARSKRAAMLYSAVLIVLAFSMPTIPAHGVSILGTSVSLKVAEILAWLAAAYYALTFFLEWRVARIINSKAIDNEFAGGVNVRFKELAEQFQAYSVQISDASTGYISAMKGVTGNIERFSEQVLAQDREAKSNPISSTTAIGSELRVARASVQDDELRRTFFHELDKASSDRLDSFKMIIQNDIAIVTTQAKTNLSAYRQINDALDKLATDFNRLSGRFNAEQKFMFYILDVGAVLLMFAAGTVVMLATSL